MYLSMKFSGEEERVDQTKWKEIHWIILQPWRLLEIPPGGAGVCHGCFGYQGTGKGAEKDPCSEEGSLPSDSCTFRIHERWQQSFVAAKRSHQKVDAVCCSNASVSLVCLLVHVMELNTGLWICKRRNRLSVSYKTAPLFLFCPQIHGGAPGAASSWLGHEAAHSNHTRARLGSPCPMSLVPSTWDLVQEGKAAAVQGGRVGTGGKHLELSSRLGAEMFSVQAASTWGEMLRRQPHTSKSRGILPSL